MGRPKYLTWLHSFGFILAIAALVIGGFRNPAIGFPIAISILIVLEIPSPKPASKELLPMILGSIKRGGMRRGIFIREMFTLAVAYLAISNFASGVTTAGLSSSVLAAALVLSSVASEIEMRLDDSKDFDFNVNFERTRVREKMEQVIEGTYFSIFEISIDAPNHEITNAYYRLKGLFAPERFGREEVLDLHEQIKVIGSVLDETHEVLSDPTLRERYRQALQS